MLFKLETISEDIVGKKLFKIKKNDFPFVIQYLDFNVANYFYEKNIDMNYLNNLFLYPDSAALYFYIKLFVNRKFKKIISTDFQENILKEINKKNVNVYLFGDKESILYNAIKSIKKKYFNINIVGFCNGYNFSSSELINEINDLNVDLLFVGLGVGRQEKWILENYKELKVKIVISVGGWFQYLAENKKRAPRLIRKLNLEWLHKLIFEFPRVWKRYLIGVPLFYFRIITKKIVINLVEK
ncbi:MAG: WecB/TagA/CpsF family glycosyltransferase [Ignavibacteriae bacterium]|nr:WecB/TagA/CpsF family glycosyltransferase [Ignavibacteriota bacterium]